MRESENVVDVLIVGAGPVGLLMANECARRGLTWRLIETRSSQSMYSKALAIFPRTLEILDMAGLAGPFTEVANRVTSVAVVAHGRTLAHMPFAPDESPYPFIAMVPQNVTEQLLLAQLQARGGAVEYETSFVTAVERDDHVAATLSHNGERQQLTAAFVVGCDGAHSAVRHLLNLPFDGAAYDALFMLADVQTNDALPADQLQLCPSEFGPARRLSDECDQAADRGDDRERRGRGALAGTRAEDSARACAAGARGERAALEQLLPDSPSSCRTTPRRAHVHRRRRRAHPQPVWRTGHEHRHARRLESGLEARSRAARPRRRSPVGKLRRRAAAGHQAGY